MGRDGCRGRAKGRGRNKGKDNAGAGGQTRTVAGQDGEGGWGAEQGWVEQGTAD